MAAVRVSLALLVSILVELITKASGQGTFVHNDLGGHIVTNEIKFPNVDWQYAEPTDTLIPTEQTGGGATKKLKQFS